MNQNYLYHSLSPVNFYPELESNSQPQPGIASNREKKHFGITFGLKLLLTMLFWSSISQSSEAHTIKFDWTKDNKMFRNQTNHLVRLHIGDKLEITCSHPNSVLYLTEHFHDYHWCYLRGEQAKPLWSYNCSQLYQEKYRMYHHKFQLPIYRYSSVTKRPNFQFGHPYFIIDVGLVDTHLEPSLENASNNPDANRDLSETTTKGTKPSTTSSATSEHSEQATSSFSQSESTKGDFSLRLAGAQSGNGSDSLEDYSMLMDDGSTGNGATGKGSSKKGQVDGEKKGGKRRNMCKQYHMKMSLFVEFRDDEVGYEHYHLPIEEEIEAVKNLILKENHASSPDFKYNSSFVYKIHPKSLKTISSTDSPKPKYVLFGRIDPESGQFITDYPNEPESTGSGNSNNQIGAIPSTPSSNGLTPELEDEYTKVDSGSEHTNFAISPDPDSSTGDVNSEMITDIAASKFKFANCVVISFIVATGARLFI